MSEEIERLERLLQKVNEDWVEDRRILQDEVAKYKARADVMEREAFRLRMQAEESLDLLNGSDRRWASDNKALKNEVDTLTHRLEYVRGDLKRFQNHAGVLEDMLDAMLPYLAQSQKEHVAMIRGILKAGNASSSRFTK